MAPPLVHLVNPLWDPHGGADHRTLETGRMLADVADVRLWSEYEPAPVFNRTHEIARVRPMRFAFPRGGTLVFVGVYFRIGHWVHFARPARVVVLYNTDQPDRLRKNLARLAHTGRPTEVVYTSAALRRRHGGDGPVLESPIDTRRFRPANGRTHRPFTVGRMSRDIRSKHHEEDPALWRALAYAGCRVRIMGGTCLSAELSGAPNVELLPAGAEDAATFLRSLDCFLYRTSQHWFESYGRVVAEAMATGLPVVVGRPGGYVDYVTDGVHGRVFSSTQDAAAAVLSLRRSHAICATCGAAARALAERLNLDWIPRRTIELLAGSGGCASTRVPPWAQTDVATGLATGLRT
jgi:glycosyltransferase involved in cell wall biosynthesis